MRQLAVVTTYGSVRDGRPIATFALNDIDSVDLEVIPVGVPRDTDYQDGAASLAMTARKDRVAVVERDLEHSPDSVRFVGWWSL